MAFGYHLLLDMYECDFDSMSSLEVCYAFLDDLCTLLNMEKQSPPFLFRSDDKKFPDKAGFSGWLPLIESGIQLHTIEPKHFISLDVYSCKKFDPEPVIEFSKNIFAPEKIEQKFLIRGHEYN